MSRMLSKMNLISVVQQLPKEDIETIQGYVEMIEQESKELKKQLEDANEKIILLQASEPMLNYKKALEENQQKEFVNYLENEIKSSLALDTINKQTAMYIYSTTLRKYKSIIGDIKNENNNLFV